MHELKLNLMQTNLQPFGGFRKKIFITLLLCK